jgi:hypothetical protein
MLNEMSPRTYYGEVKIKNKPEIMNVQAEIDMFTLFEETLEESSDPSASRCTSQRTIR